MKEVVIKQNSKRYFMLLVGGGILFIGGGILILHAGNILMQVFAIFEMTFFSLVFLFIIKRLIKPKDFLIINEEGFIDHSSAISLGFIPWEYVEDIYTRAVFSNLFISVEINKIEEVMKNTSKIKRLMLKLNQAMGYSPVSIALQSKMEHKNTLYIMNQFLEDYRNRKEKM